MQDYIADKLKKQAYEITAKLTKLAEMPVIVDIETRDEHCEFYAWLPTHPERGRWEGYKPALARFTLSEFAGTGFVVISHNAFVADKFTHRGIGTYLHQVRLDVAKQAGATAIVAHVRDSNEYERKIIQASGWEEIAKGIECPWSKEYGLSLWLKRLK